jgi:hypothetical protein
MDRQTGQGPRCAGSESHLLKSKLSSFSLEETMSNEDEKQSDELQEMLQKAATQLGEHFESVIVIATKTYNGDDFVRHKASSGSIYANYGAAKEWVISYEEKIKAHEHNKDDDE